MKTPEEFARCLLADIAPDAGTIEQEAMIAERDAEVRRAAMEEVAKLCDEAATRYQHLADAPHLRGSDFESGCLYSMIAIEGMARDIRAASTPAPR